MNARVMGGKAEKSDEVTTNQDPNLHLQMAFEQKLTHETQSPFNHLRAERDVAPTPYRCGGEEARRVGSNLRRRSISNSSPIENRSEHLLSLEKFTRENPSTARMLWIVAVDCFHCIDNFVQRPERQKSSSAAIVLGEPGFLSDYRTAGG